jgi:uncharacterized protein YaaQ
MADLYLEDIRKARQAMPELLRNPLQGLKAHAGAEKVASATAEWRKTGDALVQHVLNDTELTKQTKDVANARDELKAVGGTFKAGKFTAIEGVDSAALETAKEALEKAKKTLSTSLDHTQDGAHETIKAFGKAREEAAVFKGALRGKVKALGLGGAIKDNFVGEGVSFKSKAGRAVGVGAGLYLLKDAIGRDKVQDAQTGEEVDRSMATRAGELLLGLAGVGLAATGKVR